MSYSTYSELLAEVYLELGEAPEDIHAFNTALAKELKKLKKDAGVATIRQNYKGTGPQKFRRQLWTNFKSGAVIDLWLDSDSLGLGGVVNRRANEKEPGHPLPKRIPYGDKTPAEVYREVMPLLKRWGA